MGCLCVWGGGGGGAGRRPRGSMEKPVRRRVVVVVWLGRLLAGCDSSYKGTPLDGLAAKGMRELYRMFTSGLVMG